MSRKPKGARKRVGRPAEFGGRLAKPLAVRLPPIARECLDDLVRQQGRSHSDIARDLLIDALKPCTKDVVRSS